MPIDKIMRLTYITNMIIDTQEKREQRLAHFRALKATKLYRLYRKTWHKAYVWALQRLGEEADHIHGYDDGESKLKTN